MPEAAGTESSRYVNAATGNLVLRDQDDVLVTHGLDATAVRTYNSLGKLNDDNGDNWSTGFTHSSASVGAAQHRRAARSFALTATVRKPPIPTTSHGASTLRAPGAAPTTASPTTAPPSQYVWSDGDSGTQERYDSAATGRLLSTKDTLGNTLTYTYNAAGFDRQRRRLERRDHVLRLQRRQPDAAPHRLSLRGRLANADTRPLHVRRQQPPVDGHGGSHSGRQLDRRRQGLHHHLHLRRHQPTRRERSPSPTAPASASPTCRWAPTTASRPSGTRSTT